jgi:hypothetical protein
MFAIQPPKWVTAIKNGGPAPDFKPPLPAPADFRRQIEDLRPYLMRYASLQLRDSAAAEDAVQETLLAALAGEAGFGGRANLRTWVTGDPEAQDR